jgi:hypothetical protein
VSTLPADPARVAPPGRLSTDDRAVPRLVVATWAVLWLNTLTFLGTTIIPVPTAAGQLVTQGSLPLALVLALAANRGVVVRPHVILVLLTILAVVALLTSIHNEYFMGSTFRAVRLIGFVLVLWLVSPWFGRRDMLLLRCHLWVLRGILATVALGILVAPGTAFSFEGRLSGVLWPMMPPQVAHYAAVLLGATTLLWFCHVVRGRTAVATLLVAGGVLLATHTRTALLGEVVGLVVAGASLFLGHARVRRTSALGAVLGLLLATVFASQVTSWLMRGQSAEDAGQLTGRTKVWDQILAMHRPPLGEVFGNGMSNQSFNGLPIDSSWLATYVDQGWLGLFVDGAILLLLLLMAATHVRGPRRAVALFLVAYCVVASITETGLGTPSPYMLDLAVATALLVPEVQRRS